MNEYKEKKNTCFGITDAQCFIFFNISATHMAETVSVPWNFSFHSYHHHWTSSTNNYNSASLILSLSAASVQISALFINIHHSPAFAITMFSTGKLFPLKDCKAAPVLHKIHDKCVIIWECRNEWKWVTWKIHNVFRKVFQVND